MSTKPDNQSKATSDDVEKQLTAKKVKSDVKTETTPKPKPAPVPELDQPVVAADVDTKESTLAADLEAQEGKGRHNIGLIIKRVVLGLIGLVIIAVVVFGVLIYGYHAEGSVVTTVAKVIPYPVASVNGHFVSYSDYLFQLSANERGYAQNAKLNNQAAVNYNSAAGKKLVTQFRTASLGKVKSDAVVAQLAAKRKITVSSGDINNLVNQLYKNYGGKATLLKTLHDIYGWNLNDLKGVVRKQLLEQKLSTSVTSDPAANKQAKAKAASIVAKINAGGDFAALAKQYSQAADAATGGDLGSFTKGQVDDQIQAAVDALPVGGVSAPVKDQYGYEIIKVTEKNGDEAQASHILIKTIDFDDYLNTQVKQAKYHQYIKA